METTGSRGIGYLNPVDFFHKANASITSRHDGGFVNKKVTEEIEIEGELKAVMA